MTTSRLEAAYETALDIATLVWMLPLDELWPMMQDKDRPIFLALLEVKRRVEEGRER